MSASSSMGTVTRCDTLDDLKRYAEELPSTDPLRIFSNAIKGRQETAHIRRILHSAKDSQIKLPGGTAPSGRSKLQKATSRLNSAKTSEMVFRKQIEEKLANMKDIEREVVELERELSHKRRVALLLETLLRKEKIRVQRFAEIRALIDELRKSVTTTLSQNFLDTSDVPNPPINNPYEQPTYTRDTLVTMHGHHLQVTRLSQKATKPENQLALRDAISKHLHLPDEDPRVQDIMQRCIDQARCKARQRISYHSVLPEDVSGALDSMNKLSEVVAEKRNELQELSDLSVALMHLSHNYIDSIHDFGADTSKIIMESLKEESAHLGAKGSYVDTLKDGIIKDVVSSRRKDPPAVEHLANTIRSAQTPAAIVDRVKWLINQSVRRNGFKSLLVLKPPSHQPDTPNLIVKYKVDHSEVEDSVAKLLRRKGAKIDQAGKLIREAESYLRDGKVLANVQ